MGRGVLLLYFLLVALIPLLVFGIRTIRASEKTILEESRKILLFRTVDTANRVSNSLYACADDLEIVSSVPRNAQSYLEFCRTHRRRIWRRGGTNDNIIEIRERIPLYKEIAFIGPTGKEQILIRDEKIVPDEELRDVSIPANTTYKSEDYFQRTISLPPGEIYVSHLTGWHVTKEEQLGKAEKVEAAVEGKIYQGGNSICQADLRYGWRATGDGHAVDGSPPPDGIHPAYRPAFREFGCFSKLHKRELCVHV